ncbi:Lipoamide acyltransferase component of branched-chain alpha-keto acid dehydrogenase complex [Gemmata obscuriglobus]|uniref:Biotin attachment protein n=1 Tax=Gemmata obscuriglobus TaxID=114 RepID=A0A2Z3GY47_9BACT|nr:lipoyl domain-containing protein [Gemmata obscuriglobus]AWM38338.1 biotin attachment protein [Gemmata obscuriglobus]QEG28747.1 Lipoamide acyltransferase component of branched-chain alpha-keto acid dehydrogenase complex [Gemmata obscuriglobus]VTS07057.1 Pyruvate/2-oxoglutarate dehydrogenase complex, dihydrolipoamide acyltransferase component OS=Singulisphaera acidiphila (strain ATCC BAA-1392 / DSM 18658 / VKM B-2454 / MOB10) GN=Sinac_4820 PE=4 SV=1: Biotin_lipoyl [Gemmata obscuriglobus UQM 224
MPEPRRTAITLPDLGSARVVFSLWHVRIGDSVAEGDRVAEVLIPGATFDVPAPATGRLVETFVLPNDPLSPGAALGTVREE